MPKSDHYLIEQVEIDKLWRIASVLDETRTMSRSERRKCADKIEKVARRVYARPVEKKTLG